MDILHDPLENIQIADISLLVGTKTAENQFLEAKLKLPGQNNSDKTEFLSDIVSFANAEGGIIFYGIQEIKGFFSHLIGVHSENIDKEILRLRNIIDFGISPRIPNVEIHFLEFDLESYIIFIRIPKSWAAPHMVSLQEYNKFYIRSSNKKLIMDHSQIKQSFLLMEAIPQRMRQFRVERVNKILENPSPLSRQLPHFIIIHLIPLSAFASEQIYHLPSPDTEEGLLIPFDGYEFNSRSRFTLDGIQFLSFNHENFNRAFLIAFRNGVIETVNNRTIGDPEITYLFEFEIIKFLIKTLDYQKKMGIQPPIYFFLSLLGSSGRKMTIGSWGGTMNEKYNQGIERDQLLIPESVIPDYEYSNLPKYLKSSFDAIWNSVGWPRSQNYDEYDKWKLDLKQLLPK